jgi:hypothetical protein
MVGTTCSRASFFMNRFRNFGFINYDVGDNLRVHRSLLNVVLHDDDGLDLARGTKNAIGRIRKGSEPPRESGRLRDRERAKGRTLTALHNASSEPVRKSTISPGSFGNHS